MARKTNKLMSSLIASLLFVGLLLTPLYIADMQQTNELADISLGTAILEGVGLEDNSSIPGDFLIDDFDGDRVATFKTACQIGGSVRAQSHIGTIGGRGNLTGWGDNVSSTVLDITAPPYDTARFDIDNDGTGDSCQFLAFYNLSKADMLSSDAFAFSVNTDLGNASYVAYSLSFVTFSSLSEFGGVIGVHDVNDAVSYASWTVKDFNDGDVVFTPITTQDKLLINGNIVDDADLTATQRNMVVIGWYVDDGDLDIMEDGDLVVLDWTTLSTREGLLAGEGKIITFNIAFALIGGLLVIIATPWVSFQDIFGKMGGKRKRGDNRGADDGRSVLLWLGVAVVGIGAWMVFGNTGTGGISGFFTASLLPLSLATVGVLIVALTTKGSSNRGFAVIMATIAGVLGWMVGQSIQTNWLPYDALYVANFVDVISGGTALTNAFALSAFFVVAVQILGILVGVYNIATTVGTDETGLTQ